ncbi:MAG: hypothetical protein J6J71_01450 [Prevotella sp.]|nr:hypothetical protein [Prevotella sp.]
MKEFLKKEPVKRAIRTFIQAAAGYIAVNLGADTLTTRTAVLGLIASAIAAGIAAAMNAEEE